MCLTAGPCPVTNQVCQQPCGNPINDTWVMGADGTLRLRHQSNMCLHSTAGSASDLPVYVAPCPSPLDDTVVWRTSPYPPVNTTEYVGLCSRLQFGRVVPRSGYCFNLYIDNSWKVNDGNAVLANGTVRGGVLNTWHTISLAVTSANGVVAQIDGAVVANLPGAGGTYANGMVAINSGYNLAWFDNFSVSPST